METMNENATYPAIIAAVSMEINPLREKMKLIKIIQTPKPLRLELREGPKGPVYLGLTGMGPKAARKATELLFKNVNVNRLFSIGFVGALQKNIEIGDLVIANNCKKLKSFKPLEIANGNGHSHFLNAKQANKIAHFFKSWGRKIQIGLLLSSDQLVTKIQTKKELGQLTIGSHKALGVEMETNAILEVLKETQKNPIHFYSIRAVSDTLDENIDFDFSKIAIWNGQVKPFSFIKYMIKHPLKSFSLKNLLNNSKKAADNLADCIYQILEDKEGFFV